MKRADLHTSDRTRGLPVFVHQGVAYVPQNDVVKLQQRHNDEMLQLQAQVRELREQLGQFDKMLREFNTAHAPAHGRAAVPGALDPAGAGEYPPVRSPNAAPRGHPHRL